MPLHSEEVQTTYERNAASLVFADSTHDWSQMLTTIYGLFQMNLRSAQKTRACKDSWRSERAAENASERHAELDLTCELFTGCLE